MRVQARWALGLGGLVLALPAWAAASPVDGDQPVASASSYPPAPAVTGYQPAPLAGGYQPAPMANSYQPAPMAGSYQPPPWANSYQPAPAAATEAPAPHRHKGLFGWRHCVDCQRAHAKLRYGVDVPPPPSFVPGTAMQGQVVMAPGARCTACEANVVSGAVVANDPHAPGYVVAGGPAGPAGEAPGYAVVGGNVAMAGAPGYAVVGGAAGGADPSPIGVARSTQPQWANPRMAAYAGRPGAPGYDPSVMPSSIPPAQNALASPGHERPHIMWHVLGLPDFGGHRREREEKLRQKHAAIAYDQPNTPVTELPATMVYGNGNGKGH